MSLVVLCWCVAGCAQPTLATPPPTTITIAGASAMRPVLLDLTNAFSELHPNVVFSLRGGGSTIGLQRLTEGRVDLAASTIDASSGQLGSTEGPSTLEQLVTIPVGLDGIAIIVDPGSEISELSLDQLRDIFGGRILDWQNIDPQYALTEIRLVSREDGSGTRLHFERPVMGEDAVSLTAVVMPTSGDVVDYVSRNPGAIGYVTRAYLTGQLAMAADDSGDVSSEDRQPSVHIVPVAGALPTLDNLANQSYRLTQPLFLVSRGQPQGWVRQFIDFVLSPAGQEIVGKYHLRVR